MTKAIGIGLSANQIGLNLRFFVVQIPKITNDQRPTTNDKNTLRYF